MLIHFSIEQLLQMLYIIMSDMFYLLGYVCHQHVWDHPLEKMKQQNSHKMLCNCNKLNKHETSDFMLDGDNVKT